MFFVGLFCYCGVLFYYKFSEGWVLFSGELCDIFSKVLGDIKRILFFFCDRGVEGRVFVVG